MAFDLTRFFKHSVIYSIGNIVYRGASFLLVPLYAHYLEPAEYGALEILYVTATIFQTLFASGVAHAALRFYFEYDDPREKNTVVSSAIIGSGVVTLIGASILALFSSRFSYLLFDTDQYTFAFQVVFLALVIEISREINLAVVRAKEKSTFFVAMAFCQLVVQVGANVYLVVVREMGIVGILLGNLLATILIWIVLMTFTIRNCGFRFEMRKLVAIWKYGHPLMLSGITYSVLGSADRYLLNIYSTLAALGVYALALRVAKVIPILIVDPFSKSYGPYRFSIMKNEGARTAYSRVLTYFVLVSAFAVVVLTVLGREIVQVAATEEYWAAAGLLLPLLTVGMMDGVIYCFQTGIYIQKETRHIFHVALAAGIVKLSLNLIAIPIWGVRGAAVAAALASMTAAWVTFRISQGIYPVAYEYGRMFKILAAAAVVIAAGMPMAFDSLVMSVLVKLVVVAAFPVLVVAFRTLTPEEFERIRYAFAWLRRKIAARPAGA